MDQTLVTTPRPDANNTQKRGMRCLTKQTYQAMHIILLREVTDVSRSDLKSCCFQITTLEKSLYMATEKDSDLYEWIEDIYSVIDALI